MVSNKCVCFVYAVSLVIVPLPISGMLVYMYFKWECCYYFLFMCASRWKVDAHDSHVVCSVLKNYRLVLDDLGNYILGGK
jgi:hypothetical protein